MLLARCVIGLLQIFVCFLEHFLEYFYAPAVASVWFGQIPYMIAQMGAKHNLVILD